MTQEELIKMLREAARKDGRPNQFFERMDRKDPRPMTYTDHDRGWVERLVHGVYPDARLYSPMAASMLWGNYFQEFDDWRFTQTFASERNHSYQGALIRTDDLRASFLRTAKQDGIVGWYGRQY